MLVSRLGFGCVGLSGVYNAPLSHEAGCSVIKEAFSKGITFFDTSDLYGHKHDNEIMLGKVLHIPNPTHNKSFCSALTIFIGPINLSLS